MMNKPYYRNLREKSLIFCKNTLKYELFALEIKIFALEIKLFEKQTFLEKGRDRRGVCRAG